MSTDITMDDDDASAPAALPCYDEFVAFRPPTAVASQDSPYRSIDLKNALLIAPDNCVSRHTGKVNLDFTSADYQRACMQTAQAPPDPLVDPDNGYRWRLDRTKVSPDVQKRQNIEWYKATAYERLVGRTAFLPQAAPLDAKALLRAAMQLVDSTPRIVVYRTYNGVPLLYNSVFCQLLACAVCTMLDGGHGARVDHLSVPEWIRTVGVAIGNDAVSAFLDAMDYAQHDIRKLDALAMRTCGDCNTELPRDTVCIELGIDPDSSYKLNFHAAMALMCSLASEPLLWDNMQRSDWLLVPTTFLEFAHSSPALTRLSTALCKRGGILATHRFFGTVSPRPVATPPFQDEAGYSLFDNISMPSVPIAEKKQPAQQGEPYASVLVALAATRYVIAVADHVKHTTYDLPAKQAGVGGVVAPVAALSAAQQQQARRFATLAVLSQFGANRVARDMMTDARLLDYCTYLNQHLVPCFDAVFSVSPPLAVPRKTVERLTELLMKYHHSMTQRNQKPWQYVEHELRQQSSLTPQQLKVFYKVDAAPVLFEYNRTAHTALGLANIATELLPPPSANGAASDAVRQLTVTKMVTESSAKKCRTEGQLVTHLTGAARPALTPAFVGILPRDVDTDSVYVALSALRAEALQRGVRVETRIGRVEVFDDRVLLHRSAYRAHWMHVLYAALYRRAFSYEDGKNAFPDARVVCAYWPVARELLTLEMYQLERERRIRYAVSTWLCSVLQYWLCGREIVRIDSRSPFEAWNFALIGTPSDADGSTENTDSLAMTDAFVTRFLRTLLFRDTVRAEDLIAGDCIALRSFGVALRMALCIPSSLKKHEHLSLPHVILLGVLAHVVRRARTKTLSRTFVGNTHMVLACRYLYAAYKHRLIKFSRPMGEFEVADLEACYAADIERDIAAAADVTNPLLLARLIDVSQQRQTVPMQRTAGDAGVALRDRLFEVATRVALQRLYGGSIDTIEHKSSRKRAQQNAHELGKDNPMSREFASIHNGPETEITPVVPDFFPSSSSAAAASAAASTPPEFVSANVHKNKPKKKHGKAAVAASLGSDKPAKQRFTVHTEDEQQQCGLDLIRFILIATVADDVNEEDAVLPRALIRAMLFSLQSNNDLFGCADHYRAKGGRKGEQFSQRYVRALAHCNQVFAAEKAARSFLSPVYAQFDHQSARVHYPLDSGVNDQCITNTVRVLALLEQYCIVAPPTNKTQRDACANHWAACLQNTVDAPTVRDSLCHYLPIAMPGTVWGFRTHWYGAIGVAAAAQPDAPTDALSMPQRASLSNEQYARTVLHTMHLLCDFNRVAQKRPLPNRGSIDSIERLSEWQPYRMLDEAVLRNTRHIPDDAPQPQRQWYE